MPSSNNLPVNNNNHNAANAPMAFRRQRFWFISFLMSPFKDLDERTINRPTFREMTRHNNR